MITETERARQIVAGQKKVEDAVLHTSLLRTHFIRALKKLKDGTIRITDLIATPNGADTTNASVQKELRDNFLVEMAAVVEYDKQIGSLKATLKRYTHKSEKYAECWEEIRKIEDAASDHTAKLGISPRLLAMCLIKIKSMVVRIKKVNTHFQTLKERYGHEAKEIKAYNRYIERNEDLAIVERDLGCSLDEAKSVIAEIQDQERILRRMEAEVGSPHETILLWGEKIEEGESEIAAAKVG